MFSFARNPKRIVRCPAVVSVSSGRDVSMESEFSVDFRTKSRYLCKCKAADRIVVLMLFVRRAGRGLESVATKNQIRVIKPYWHHGTWVFDDPIADLVQEPFVSGVPEMIDDLVADMPDARQGFRMLFSADPFPGYQRKLVWVREEMGGNWYRADQPPNEGWLCPALFRYFETAPPELFVKAEPLGP